MNSSAVIRFPGMLPIRNISYLFLIRVKVLFEPMVLRGKKSRQVFALFKNIFLRNLPLSNARIGKWNWDGKSVFN